MTPTHGPVESCAWPWRVVFSSDHSMTMESALGSIPIDSTFSDFREVDGITIPFRTVQQNAHSRRSSPPSRASSTTRTSPQTLSSSRPRSRLYWRRVPAKAR